MYATRGYVAAEIASGLIVTGQAQKATELLREHHDTWPAEQYRDFAVASTRLLHALVTLGDYHAANNHLDTADRAYRAAPSDRARRELRHCRKIIRDRARANRSLPLHTRVADRWRPSAGCLTLVVWRSARCHEVPLMRGHINEL